jgi:hypothetical protein
VKGEKRSFLTLIYWQKKPSGKSEGLRKRMGLDTRKSRLTSHRHPTRIGEYKKKARPMRTGLA